MPSPDKTITIAMTFDEARWLAADLRRLDRGVITKRREPLVRKLEQALAAASTTKLDGPSVNPAGGDGSPSDLGLRSTPADPLTGNEATP